MSAPGFAASPLTVVVGGVMCADDAACGWQSPANLPQILGSTASIAANQSRKPEKKEEA